MLFSRYWVKIAHRTSAGTPGTSVAGAIHDEIASRGSTGGIIATSADRSIVIAHNSPAMFAAFRDGDQLVTLT